MIDDFLQPKLDWRSILTDMIVSNAKNDYRLSPPNKKHLWRGFYLPSLQGEKITIAFGIDVSGSISDDEIQEALSEVHGICQQAIYHQHVFQWAFRQHRFRDYTRKLSCVIAVTIYNLIIPNEAKVYIIKVV